MHDTLRTQGRLSVFYEQDLVDDDEARPVKEESVEIRRKPADDSLHFTADSNNNNNNDSLNNSSFYLNESIESSGHNESSELNNSNSATPPPPPVVRRRKNITRPRSRERSFVYVASGAVVGGARSVARTFKRMSLIESGSSSSIRERIAQDGGSCVKQLKANDKHKQRYNSSPSLPQSYVNSGAPLQSSGSAHSLGSSPSPSPRSSQGKGGAATAGKGFNTAKQHDQQAAAAAASSSATAAAAAAAGVPATGTTTTAPTTTGASNAAAAAAAAAAASSQQPDKDKEKKRKEVSSSRVKKFHRHFSQVSKDEKLINYFSCALVGDIPLQGHLYITDVHFAFYSNVFGYVTKVVIPTSSVTKISKEKTAKIIPNAVGVAAGDERHVFGSFISREAAFRLMCTVCSQLNNGMEILPKPLPLADVDLTEEYLLDDDSSCSISGNESPPHMRDAAAATAAAVAAGAASEPEMSLRQRDRHSDLAGKSAPSALEHGQVTIRSSAPPIVQYEEPQQHVAATAGSRLLSSPSLTAPPSSSSSMPITILGVPAAPTVASSKFSSLRHSLPSRMRLQLPTLTELHVLYLGIMLAIMLALFSVFLLYRILDIEAKTNLYNTPVDFNVRSGNDEDIFAEALRWQKELQDKSTAEAQHILSKNLEQISKVRRSLETLSMLIHDRRAGFGQPAATEAVVAAVANSAASAAVLEPELDASPVGAASSDILSD